MSNVLIPYGTTEGQTAQIADYMAEVIRGHGHQVRAVNIKKSKDEPLEGYDGIIIGASVHMGKHEGYVADFVRNNRVALDQLPSAFFSVSLAAHGDPENAQSYIDEFEQDVQWRPAQVGLFSGALLYTQYGFVKRHIMKKIASEKPGHLGTDTSRDYVYTEWDGVKRFVEDFLVRLAPQRTDDDQLGQPRASGRASI